MNIGNYKTKFDTASIMHFNAITSELDNLSESIGAMHYAAMFFRNGKKSDSIFGARIDPDGLLQFAAHAIQLSCETTGSNVENAVECVYKHLKSGRKFESLDLRGVDLSESQS